MLERRAKIKNQQGVVKKELKQARKARKATARRREIALGYRVRGVPQPPSRPRPTSSSEAQLLEALADGLELTCAELDQLAALPAPGRASRARPPRRSRGA